MSTEGFHKNALEFGEGENEEFGVESESETMPLNKRKEMRIDGLSELPDSILIHILSFLFIKEAGRTSVLSKRWKFLWIGLTSLEFNEIPRGAEKTIDFVSWVNRTLDSRKANYVEKFLISFMFYAERFAFDVDAWIEYSIKNEVKQFALFIFPYGVYYKVPRVMYSCSSLTELHLIRCIMSCEITITIEWRRLTRLFLQEVKLNEHLVDEILSSCPVLFYLSLEKCWGFSRLEVNSRHLNKLRVEESYDQSILEISAPYVRDFHITVSPGGRMCQIKNISTVVSAYVDFVEYYGEEVMVNAKGFFENFKHVKKLWVGQQCFEVLSKMAMKGWQFPQPRLQHLSLLSCSEYEHSIPGIIGLLESSPNIETLRLEGYETENIIFNLDPATKGDLDGDLLHLKKIRIENFADPNGEPLLTLARILLLRATVLEEMKIVIDVEDTSDYVNIVQTLLTYPRSSSKAEIYLTSPFSHPNVDLMQQVELLRHDLTRQQAKSESQKRLLQLVAQRMGIDISADLAAMAGASGEGSSQPNVGGTAGWMEDEDEENE